MNLNQRKSTGRGGARPGAMKTRTESTDTANGCYIYDKSTNRTVGVLRGQSLAPDDDPVSYMLVSEAERNNHKLVAYPLRSGTFEKALEVFREGKIDLIRYTASLAGGPEDPFLDESWLANRSEQQRVAREKRLGKSQRKYSTQKISEETKHNICSLKRRGFSIRRIAKETGTSTTSVQSILKAEMPTESA